jgi:hypothetical protein
MKVLLDECLPRKLKLDIDGEVVKTVPEMGWTGIENGKLLRLAEAEFDVSLRAIVILNTNRISKSSR